MKSTIVYLGLGSNLGQRESNLAGAIHLLGRQVRLLRTSSIYETAPWGYTEQPDFLNSVLEVDTSLSPPSLLDLVKAVEEEIGREPTFRYGPRLVDVDILLYGDLVIEEPDLQIPHARMHERAFVLVPLMELASEFVHPTSKLTIAQLTNQVEDKEGVKLWGPPSPLSEK